MSISGPAYVVGAAGRQGAAAFSHLRELGVETRALFDERDARRDEPHWTGNSAVSVPFDDRPALERTLRGAGALVLVLEDPNTSPIERLRYGHTFVDAAVQAGVDHVVFSAATGPDHHRLSCDVSAETAGYLRRREAPATVLRPATIMEEVPWYWLSRLGPDVTLATPFVADARLPLVAVDDVGMLAALAVTRPDEFAGRDLDVAGDTQTPLGLTALLEAALGEPVRYEEVQVEGVFVYQEASTQIRDIDWLRDRYPRLHTFAGWLAEGGGLELCRHAAGIAAPHEERQAA